VVRVQGVDARGRAPFWVAEIEDGELVDLHAAGDLDAALAADEEVATIAVDVPLGHEDPRGESDGWRACDVAAREVLGEAGERFFVLPPPAVFAADTYHEALAMCRERGWPKLEAALWFAADRLAALADRAGRDQRLVEVHPEVSFAHMDAGRRPPEHYGSSWAALDERLERLHGEDLHPEEVEPADHDPRPALDACAAAWTAHRVSRGQARRLPGDPPSDPRTGRLVAVHA
jgi:predicted RNase H-like nuclease